VRSSDVVANQVQYVAKDAVHQLSGYRGNLLLLAAVTIVTVDQSRDQSLYITNTTANKTVNY